MTECNCNKLDAKVFKCRDCATCTLCTDEYYMVEDAIWEVATENFGGRGLLCIGCLEERLGRKLVANDFPDYPVNNGFFPQSTRLKSRLTNDAITISV